MLFLQPNMRVIPISTMMRNGKLIGESAVGFDGWGGEIRNSVLFIWEQDAVPMDKCVFIKIISNIDTEGISNIGIYTRYWYLPVDTNCYLCDLRYYS